MVLLVPAHIEEVPVILPAGPGNGLIVTVAFPLMLLMQVVVALVAITV